MPKVQGALPQKARRLLAPLLRSPPLRLPPPATELYGSRRLHYCLYNHCTRSRRALGSDVCKAVFGCFTPLTRVHVDHCATALRRRLPAWPRRRHGDGVACGRKSTPRQKTNAAAPRRRGAIGPHPRSSSAWARCKVQGAQWAQASGSRQRAQAQSVARAGRQMHLQRPQSVAAPPPGGELRGGRRQ